jgi:hypothetical protein
MAVRGRHPLLLNPEDPHEGAVLDMYHSAPQRKGYAFLRALSLLGCEHRKQTGVELPSLNGRSLGLRRVGAQARIEVRLNQDNSDDAEYLKELEQASKAHGVKAALLSDCLVAGLILTKRRYEELLGVEFGLAKHLEEIALQYGRDNFRYEAIDLYDRVVKSKAQMGNGLPVPKRASQPIRTATGSSVATASATESVIIAAPGAPVMQKQQEPAPVIEKVAVASEPTVSTLPANDNPVPESSALPEVNEAINADKPVVDWGAKFGGLAGRKGG